MPKEFCKKIRREIVFYQPFYYMTLSSLSTTPVSGTYGGLTIKNKQSEK